MKTRLLLIFLAPLFIFAQFGSEQLITLNTNNHVEELFHIDLNNDGLKDLVYNNYQLRWMENQGASYASPVDVSVGSSGAFKTAFLDKENDGDIDILTHPWQGSNIRWNEGLGNGTFISSMYYFTDNEMNRHDIFTNVDLNQDGVLDILYSSVYDLRTMFFLLDSVGNKTKPFNFLPFGTTDFGITYLDTDTMRDIIICPGGLRQIEQTGPNSFVQSPISTSASGLGSDIELELLDVDNDQDEDIILGSLYAKWIGYYENILDSVSYYPTTIDTLFEVSDLIAEDVNGDGLKDLVACSRAEDKIVWYENLGNGSFSNQILISDSVRWPGEILVTDFDGDGMKDVLSYSEYPGEIRIVWFKNYFASPVGLSEVQSQEIMVYPNPASDFIQIVSKNQVSEVNIHSIIGQESEKLSVRSNKINVSHLSSGTYILEIKIENQTHREKLVIN
jgi:hypothetical protein